MILIRLIYHTALLLAVASYPAHAAAQNQDNSRRLMVAAAASIKPAMEDIIASFRQSHPAIEIIASYGSSGKIATQIINGAPFDIFFAADMVYPQRLVDEGQAVPPATVYALGRLALWQRGPIEPVLAELGDRTGARVAIANPRHAPYGQRAREALINQGLWDDVQPRLVFGENVAQTAQFAQSGAADLGLIALALALNPVLQEQGSHSVVDAGLHEPLKHGYTLTRRGENNSAAADFTHYLGGAEAGAILRRHGFELPAPAVSPQGQDHTTQ